jgi:dihydroorotate dehydrogenase electron transfer subunit
MNTARPFASLCLRDARVESNVALCREHFRVSMRLPSFPPAAPGQFVHLAPPTADTNAYREIEPCNTAPACSANWRSSVLDPILRRAFSIAELKVDGDGARIAVIHRVVGKTTRWLASLEPGARVSVLGPLGNAFPIVRTKPLAWVVAGGVGLPPMLWLARALREAGRDTVAFCGARAGDLLPLTPIPGVPPAEDASTARLCMEEFARRGVPAIISTDEGSLGYRGSIAEALRAYHAAHPVDPRAVVVYACGPERMLQAVAHLAERNGWECYLCVEREMACGLGTCQSCVIRVRDAVDPAGWRYRLCCTDGPIFPSSEVLWT